MRGIIVNTSAEADALIAEIDTKFSFLFKGITSTYTHYFEHPSNGTFFVVLDQEDVDAMAAQFPEIMATMSFQPEDVVTGVQSEWIDESIIE